MGHSAANSAGIEGCPSDWTGVAVPRSSPAGVQGLDTGRVGSLGKQPQGEILFADQDRAEATASRARRLGPHLNGNRPSAEVGGSMLKDWLTEWLTRLGFLMSPKPHREIDDELQFHIERQAQEYITTGMPPREARRKEILAL